jgi:hypothetical protein
MTKPATSATPTNEGKLRALQGARIKAWLVTIAMVVGLYVTWVLINRSGPENVAVPPERAIAIDQSDAAQRERQARVDKLIADGLVRRIDKARDGSPRVTLRPPFYVLDPETRRTHIEVIYALYFDGSRVTDTVYLRDSRHGNEVGEFNPYAGGLRMVR